ncbi:MAG TPA: type IV toxin-antitoxin system AbiEi family antitoxin domain-containing protein [Ilumatobacteraceae bacterium]|nr:type IV toxin-antitoxin system AbiEi family antitoxin domain-containing protein [Ilumatobacteraceae bacterium]
MARLNPAAHAVLARQHGVASTQQLLDSGLSRRQLHRLQQHGGLELVLRGAYRTPSAPVTELSQCAAVCSARPDLAIAGPTAGRLWGFRRLPPDRRIHVIAPRASNPAIARWVVPYRTDARHEHDVIERDDGIRVTSRARTALDLARWLGPDDLLSVIEQVAKDGRVGDDEFLAVAADWLSPRRPWARAFLQALDRRLPGGPAESHPEVRVAEALGHAGVRGLVRQHRIHLPGHGDIRFDLAIPELRWAVEVDLHPRHRETMGLASDARRDRAAGTAGWNTSRITKTQYDDRFNETIADLASLHTHLRRRLAG